MIMNNCAMTHKNEGVMNSYIFWKRDKINEQAKEKILSITTIYSNTEYSNNILIIY